MSQEQIKPLAGIRVLDLTDWVSGPFASLTLAEFGADVVKVERPGRGDPFRNFGLRRAGVSAFWTNINHGKRSISLDLRSPGGVNATRALAAEADVFIQNWRPGKAEEMGLGDDALAAVNPRLIRVAISGFGSSGPRAAAPAFDGVLQALSGVVAAQGRGKRPESVAMYLIDKLTSTYAVQAILAMLIERQASGIGRKAEIAMLDVAAHFNFPDLFQEQTFLESEARLSDPRSPVIATQDGHIIIVPVSGKQIAATCRAFGHPEWIEDLKAITDANLLIGTLYDLVEGAVAGMPTGEALRRLADVDVAASAVLNQDAHLIDPQVEHNDLYFMSDHPTCGRIRRVRYPALFDGAPLAPISIAAAAGEHTEEVLRDWSAALEPHDKF